MPYEVRVCDTFHACHAIATPAGDMEPLHWHAWGVEVVFEGAELDRAGVLVDFEVVKRYLREILDALEGANLNDHEFVRGAPPSAEHVARRIAETLACRGEWAPARLSRVRIREAEGCDAVYVVA